MTPEKDTLTEIVSNQDTVKEAAILGAQDQDSQLKETPTQSRSDTFGHSTTLKETPTPKTVEEVVLNAQCDAGDVVTGWVVQADEVRRILTAQNQAADERLREVVDTILKDIFDKRLSGWSNDLRGLQQDIKTIAAQHGITNL